MGRGLSELQQTILLLGLRGREGKAQAVEDQPAADVHYDDILAEHWLWKPTPPPARDRRLSKGRRFDPYEIGAPYNHAHAALSRAVTRLVGRGLATRVPRSASHGVGVALTDAGVAAAYRLLERLARTRPGPARGGSGPGDLHAEGWRQFAAMLDRRHEKIRRDEEERRQFQKRVRQQQEERRREEARQAQERLRQQQEREQREYRENRHRRLEDLIRRLQDRLLSRAGMLPPEVAAALGVLGLSYPCSAAEIKAAFRRKALEVHSDHGGTDREFIALKAAYDSVLKYAS